MKRLIALGLLLSAASLAGAQEAAKTPPVFLSPSDHPAAETAFVPPPGAEPTPKADPFLYEKTGLKKGLQGKAVTEEELFTAPDVAVLNRGFFEPWQAILAGLQEPVALAKPDDVAALIATKPLLIIPSGGLAGTSGSDFFRAGLAEYAGSGGIIFCLAQRSGSDYSALPVPQGKALTAAGWSEDFGPLYKASTIKNRHPLLARLSTSVPALETDGYFTNYPDKAQVLLVRPDAYPTVIVYPFGKGWVVATTFFSDLTSILGGGAPDESGLYRGLLSWVRETATTSSDKSGAAGVQPSHAGQASPNLSSSSLPGFAASARPVVRAAIARSKDKLTVTLDIVPSQQLVGQNAIARVGSEEKYFKLAKDMHRVTFELPVTEGAERIAYALYHGTGRALARGSLEVPQLNEGVSLDRSSYLPGDKAVVSVSGVGKGEFTLSGMGLFDNKIMGDRGEMPFVVPGDLPAGLYPLHWELENVSSGKKQGDLSIAISGYEAAFDSVTIGKKSVAGRINVTASFKIRATQKISGRLSVALRSPDGKSTTVAEPVVSLVAGAQTVPVTFSYSPKQGGVWELAYTFSVNLPSGPGSPSGPLVIASGSALFDEGNAVVLGLLTGKPLYYETAGTVEATAIIFGKGKASVELLLDDKRVVRERVELAGAYRLEAQLPQLEAGAHTLRVSVAAGDFESSRERLFTYGLRLPDLALSMELPEIHGPVLPVAVTIRNRGKGIAGSTRVALYEGEPSKGGLLIAKSDIPPLAPGGYYSAKLDWPLSRKAGKRMLLAVADADNALTEASKKNNRVSKEVIVPDLLLALTPAKNSLSADEALSFSAQVFNAADRAYKNLSLRVQLTDRSGRAVNSEKSSIPELAAGQEQKIPGSLKSVVLPMGEYRLSAALNRDKILASAEAAVNILPTLLLAGDLDGTPGRAVLCRPFTVHYNVKSAGNVSPTSGSLTLEIIAKGSGKPVFSKQLPYAVAEKSCEIEKKDFLQGDYTLRLKATAADRQNGLSREFVLAEKPLTIAGPVAIETSHAPFPRVLVWLGRSDSEVERALTGSVAGEAFDQQDLYYKVVRSAEEFMSQAMTGLFNTYVLVEPGEPLEKSDWLRESVERGQGLVIIGSGDIARSLGETLGFTFSEAPASARGAMITLAEKSGLGLSGSIPISGKMLVPHKKGAKQAALYSESSKPAILSDRSGKGGILVLPFSLSRSAFDAGTSSLFSLLLRKSALAAMPEVEESGGAGQIVAVSAGGAVKTKIKEVLPTGAKVLWAGADGAVSGNTITYEFTADKEPKKLLYLYQAAGQDKTGTATEVFYDCGGVFLSQGKVE